MRWSRRHSMTSSKHSPAVHRLGSGGSLAGACGTRSQTPLHPDWLSSQSTASPARCSTSSRFSWVAGASPPSLRVNGENMQGTDTSVLVPQGLTSLKFTRSPCACQRASAGVVGRS